jgi:hypothetical protein
MQKRKRRLTEEEAGPQRGGGGDCGPASKVKSTNQKQRGAHLAESTRVDGGEKQERREEKKEKKKKACDKRSRLTGDEHQVGKNIG